MIISSPVDGKSNLSENPENPKLSFRLGCLARGWSIFPLHGIVRGDDGAPACACGDKSCKQIGKHPAISWNRSIDPRWKGAVNYVRVWHAADPSRGWGVHLGKSGLIGIDVDNRHGGMDSYQKIREQGILGSEVPHVVTGSGGFHFYFQAPAGVLPQRGWVGGNGETRNHFLGALPGIDIKCGQSYLALPFSPHKCGTDYVGAIPQTIPECPAAQVEFWSNQPAFQERPRPAHFFLASPHGAPGRPTESTLAAAWAYICEMPVPVHDGTHSRVMCRMARLLWGEFGLERAEVKSLLIRRESQAGGQSTDREYERFLDYGEKYVGTRGWRNNVPSGGADRAAAETFAKTGSLDMTFGNWRLNEQTGEIERVKDADNLNRDEAKIFSEIGGEGPIPAVGEDTPEQVETPKRLYCQHRCTVCLRHIRTRRKRLQRFPCRRLICPACFVGKKDEYKSTVSYRLLQLYVAMGRVDDAKVFVAHISPAAWHRVGRRIRAALGDFFRIDLHAQGDESGATFLVVSTVAVGKADWQEISLADAQASLWSAVDNLGRNLTKRVFWTSRGWKIHNDEPVRPKEWSREHSVKCPPVAQRQILQFHGIEFESKYGGGQTWGWQADEFQCSDELWEGIRADLEAGFPLSLEINITDDDVPAAAADTRTVEEIFLSG